MELSGGRPTRARDVPAHPRAPHPTTATRVQPARIAPPRPKEPNPCPDARYLRIRMRTAARPAVADEVRARSGEASRRTAVRKAYEESRLTLQFGIRPAPRFWSLVPAVRRRSLVDCGCHGAGGRWTTTGAGLRCCRAAAHYTGSPCPFQCSMLDVTPSDQAMESKSLVGRMPFRRGVIFTSQGVST